MCVCIMPACVPPGSYACRRGVKATSTRFFSPVCLLFLLATCALAMYDIILIVYHTYIIEQKSGL